MKLDFRHLPDGHVVTAAEVEAELKRIAREGRDVPHTFGSFDHFKD